jgi:hypothetical protein
MEIPQQDNPTKNLFHSVDHLRSNRATVVLTCLPVVESEARNIVSSLAAYLKQRHGDEVIEFFMKDAQVRARESYWDEEHQCVSNEDDAQYVDSLLNDIDADYGLPPVSKKKQTANPPQRPTPTSLQRNTLYRHLQTHVSTHHLSVQPLDDVAHYVVALLIGCAYETLSVQPLDDVACYAMYLLEVLKRVMHTWRKCVLK